ncbi:MAG: UDP-N-acetylmuramoyl-L-alanyl-D-glutamate--2,6-diaminopimelate ligase, partial [Chlorobiales bacterium]|nr:UDP-N-acetylmuramoyl-L-alanyl-D-glutamate--2,6-diaminopimelate ligase [Chlorobiales bacterium]
MQLKTLIEKISPLEIQGELCQEYEVAGLAYDSRRVVPNSLFVAIRGFKTDGHQFIGKAIAARAGAIVCEEFPEKRLAGIGHFYIRHTRQKLFR